MNERVFYQACPLCNAPEFVDYSVGDCSGHALYQAVLSPRIIWKQCRICKHIFTAGYFTDEACKVIFSRTHKNQQVGYDLENQRLVSARMIEKVLPFASSGPWLDVGFGNGALLLTAQEYGYEPIGVDLRSDNVRALASLGIQAHCQTLDQLAIANECAVVSMADVLEHMPYPGDGLKSAHRLLRAGGVLFLSMPNTENALWQILDRNKANPYWGEIEHYHNFSRSRLYQLLRESGFEPVRYGVSERYRICMEVVARKTQAPSQG